MTQPKKCPKCGTSTIMVEYNLMDSYHYDGVSEYACRKNFADGSCDWRIGRWCGKELGAGEKEPPFHSEESLGHPRIQII